MSPAAYCSLIREHISGTVTVFQDIMDSELPDVKVGIGVHGDRTSVEACAKRFPGNVIIYDDADALVDDLVSGKIDAAVRGNMSSSVLLPILKRKLGLPELERIVLLEPKGGRLFCMAPVGIDEGWTLEQNYDVDTEDWNNASKDQIVNKIKQAAQDGSLEGAIVLCHETYATTAAAMEEVLPWLAQNGYQNVNISDMAKAHGKTLAGGQIHTRA